MKIDRLLAMTVLLLNRGRISAKELAERFEVSTKTIYRDMDTLCQAGIPIAAYQGTSGGFEMMEQFTISRQFLTLQEINSIILAVRGVNQALDDNTYDHLLEKVSSLLSQADRLPSAGTSDPLIVDLNPWGQGPSTRHKVNVIRHAIEERCVVSFHYMNMHGEESERDAEPSALILKGNVWYLQAYCRLRSEFRVFRLSRIYDLALQSMRFDRREAPSMEGYVWDSSWSREEEKAIKLSFSPQVRYRVEETFEPGQVLVGADGSVRVEGDFNDDEWFYGMLLSFGHQVRVEQPPAVAAEVVRRAKQIIEQYSN
ncbi:helix-turn-helix transcriptional regulator [Paenibacillus guangzhouensis]|uniref:helix-turn-helix transcriptional regulator n=1 Tax=Paenibacillus guangzhouensis TaxID=1473112 RepID=UPI0012676C5C|nr:YafY family protein [Paenibacillus guangzhouensis]